MGLRNYIVLDFSRGQRGRRLRLPVSDQTPNRLALEQIAPRASATRGENEPWERTTDDRVRVRQEFEAAV